MPYGSVMVGVLSFATDAAVGAASSVAPGRLMVGHALPTPGPFQSPGLVSPANRYTGQPCRVSCQVPSARSTLPTMDGETPFRAGLPCHSTGGHLCAQAPLHVDVGWGMPLSLSKR